jgi:FMN phosphatase YigB (HAD superfamily)
MVASHIFDLNAAKKVGFKTCLITRELEPGCDPKDLDHAVDYIFNSIEHLAEKVRAL